MSITHLTSLPELNTVLKKNNDKLVVIDFHAKWCGPCHAIAPRYEQLAKEYSTKAVLCKVDVDEAKDLARAYQVSAMPTFVFVRGERKLGQLKGADPRALEASIKQYVSSTASSTSPFPGQGHSLSGGSSTPVPTEIPPVEPVNYLKWIVIAALVYAWFTYSAKSG